MRSPLRDGSPAKITTPPGFRTRKNSPKKRTGEDGCPVSALYWDFIGRNEDRFAGNHRMAMPVRGWQKFDAAEQQAIKSRAALARDELAGLRPDAER